MKHLLFILDYYPPHRWGAENVYQHIIEGLLAKGYKVSLITTKFSPELKKVEHHKDYKDFTLYRTGTNRKNFLFSAIKTGIQLFRQRKLDDIDGIHTATYGGAIPAWILAKIFRKKILLTVHEIFGKLWEIYKWYWWSLPYQRFEKLLFTLPFDAYHCVSRYTMNCLRIVYWISDRKIHMIYNGIDNDFWDPKTLDKKKLAYFKQQHAIAISSNTTSSKMNNCTTNLVGLYYGHAGKSKGLDYLIDAIIPILKQNPHIQFIFNIIASQNSQTAIKKLQAIQKEYHRENRLLVFDGFPIDELKLLVASSDFIIAPSLAEGFGSVHSEASQMWKILITTSVAAIPEVVYWKIKFITPCNSNAIVQAVAEIQKENYEILPKKYFDWKNTIKILQSLYTTLL